MIKKLLIILIPFLVLLYADYATDAGTGSTAAAISDSCDAVRGAIRDTAAAVVSDSGVSAATLSDTADVVRGQVRCSCCARVVRACR